MTPRKVVTKFFAHSNAKRKLSAKLRRIGRWKFDKRDVRRNMDPFTGLQLIVRKPVLVATYIIAEGHVAGESDAAESPSRKWQNKNHATPRPSRPDTRYFRSESCSLVRSAHMTLTRSNRNSLSRAPLKQEQKKMRKFRTSRYHCERYHSDARI